MNARRGFSPTIWLALVAVIAVATAVVARNWSCRQGRQDTEPEIQTVGPYVVSSVPTGRTIIVKFGVRNRRHDTATLLGIATPSDSIFAEKSRASLESLAGKSITADVANEQWGRDEITGTVYGESGACLQLAQLEAGMAKIDDSHGKPPASWTAAQKAAQKAKRGVWSLKQLPKSEE